MGSGLKIRFKQVLQYVVTPKNYWSRLYIITKSFCMRNESASNYISYKFEKDRANSVRMVRCVNSPLRLAPLTRL